jgi:aminoglycoside/choline kinase family phosphotransferase
MGSRFLEALTPLVRSKARPIMNSQDYDRAKQRLAEVLGQPAWMQESNRIEALSMAINEFEARYVTREVQLAVEWAECVFIPPLDTPQRNPRRRWND